MGLASLLFVCSLDSTFERKQKRPAGNTRCEKTTVARGVTSIGCKRDRGAAGGGGREYRLRSVR